MNVRQTTTEDYQTLVDWWKFWRFPAPAIEFLPDQGRCGMMVQGDDGTEYCAGFIYETNSKVCLMEFIVANPKIRDGELRGEALTLLIDTLSYLAKDWGYQWVFTSIKHPSLMQRYKECGFQIGSTNTNEMIKVL